MSAGAPNVDILIDGNEIPDADFVSYVVDRDMFQPDSAKIVLSNQNDIHTARMKPGLSVEIKTGDDKTSIFKGELVEIHPNYQGGDKTTIAIVAFNKLHRLLRIRKSRTFQQKTDQQILSQVCGDAGLTLEFKHEKSITYDHVYQHNLTDLEFVRMRAARLGCHVWCVDTKVFVKEPELDKAATTKLEVDKAGKLRRFSPRMSSAPVVKKVTIRAWDPKKKEQITGEAEAQNSALAKENAVTASGDHGREETFVVDQPVGSREEAQVLAKARLRDLNLGFITGDAECAGDPTVQLGGIAEIIANANAADDNFNGNYYIMGVCHRHTMPKSAEGGYVTILKLARDGQKKK